MGKKYTGEEALAAGIVSHACLGTEVMDVAMKMAEKAAKENYGSEALAMIKLNLYEGEYKTLCGPLLYSSKLWQNQRNLYYDSALYSTNTHDFQQI